MCSDRANVLESSLSTLVQLQHGCHLTSRSFEIFAEFSTFIPAPGLFKISVGSTVAVEQNFLGSHNITGLSLSAVQGSTWNTNVGQATTFGD